MDIKHIRRFHELLYCAVLGGMISATMYLVSGTVPGLVSTLLYGWTASNFISAMTEKRRAAQVEKLKFLHDQPAREQDARNNEKK